jgi:WD40 repeat protein
VQEQKEIAMFKQPTKHLYSVAFSPDGKTLASGSGGLVRLWDVTEQKEVAALEGHREGVVMSVAFSPDGEVLASGSYDETVRLWDVEAGKEVALLSEHSYVVSSVVFSPDGKWLASGSWDGTVLLWEMNIQLPDKSVEPMEKQLGTWGKVKRTELLQNYPNPFNPETWIPFALSKSGHAIIRIHSSTGQLVRTLDLGYKPPGAYLNKEKAAYWDGRNEEGDLVASDVYFYAMEAGESTSLRKMAMIR